MNGIMPQQVQGGLALGNNFGQRQPSLAHAQTQAAKNPNPVTQLAPNPAGATTQSVQQALQKAGQAWTESVLSKAPVNALGARVRGVLQAVKYAYPQENSGKTRHGNRVMAKKKPAGVMPAAGNVSGSLNASAGPLDKNGAHSISSFGIRKAAFAYSDHASVLGREPAVLSHHSSVLGREPAVLSREPAVLSREPAVLSREPAVLSRGWPWQGDAPTFASLTGECATSRIFKVANPVTPAPVSAPPPGFGSNAGNAMQPPPGPPPMPGPGQAVPPAVPQQAPGQPPPGQPVAGTSPVESPPPPPRHARRNIRGQLMSLLAKKNLVPRGKDVAADMKHQQMALGKMAGDSNTSFGKYASSPPKVAPGASGSPQAAVGGPPVASPSAGPLAKRGAQDNTRSRRSATGESKGLSYAHKPDHYAQGRDAWDSVSGYFKGSKYLKGKPDPFAGDHSGSQKSAVAREVGKALRLGGKGLVDAASLVASSLPASIGGGVRQLSGLLSSAGSGAVGLLRAPSTAGEMAVKSLGNSHGLSQEVVEALRRAASLGQLDKQVGTGAITATGLGGYLGLDHLARSDNKSIPEYLSGKASKLNLGAPDSILKKGFFPGSSFVLPAAGAAVGKAVDGDRGAAVGTGAGLGVAQSGWIPMASGMLIPSSRQGIVDATKMNRLRMLAALGKGNKGQAALSALGIPFKAVGAAMKDKKLQAIIAASGVGGGAIGGVLGGKAYDAAGGEPSPKWGKPPSALGKAAAEAAKVSSGGSKAPQASQAKAPQPRQAPRTAQSGPGQPQRPATPQASPGGPQKARPQQPQRSAQPQPQQAQQQPQQAQQQPQQAQQPQFSQVAAPPNPATGAVQQQQAVAVPVPVPVPTRTPTNREMVDYGQPALQRQLTKGQGAGGPNVSTQNAVTGMSNPGMPKQTQTAPASPGAAAMATKSAMDDLYACGEDPDSPLYKKTVADKKRRAAERLNKSAMAEFLLEGALLEKTAGLEEPASRPFDGAGLLQVGGGLGSMAAGAHIARSGYGAVAPSYLQMGRSVWADGQNAQELRKAIGKDYGLVRRLAVSNPASFYRLLAGHAVPGVADDLATKVRDLTFGGQAGSKARTGDLLLSSSAADATGTMGKAIRRATGGEYHHVDVFSDPGRTFSFPHGDRAGKAYGSSLFPDPSNPNWRNDEYVQLRLRPSKVDDSTAAYGGKAVRRFMRSPALYDGSKITELAAGELLPETRVFGANRAIGSGLRRLLSVGPVRNVLSGLIGGDRLNNVLNSPPPGCASGICSTRAVGAVESMMPGALKGLEHASPADLVRATGKGKPLSVAEVFLPPSLRSGEFLKSQHSQRLAPFKARLPVVAGALGLGSYAAARGLGLFGTDTKGGNNGRPSNSA